MTVRRRTVWYVHGFDPATTARYRRIFAAASERLDVVIEDLPGGAAGWRARRGETVTDVRHLRYEDLVRAWRAGPLWRRLWRGARAFAGSCREGAMQRLLRRAPWVPGLAVFPFLVLGAPVAVAALAFVAGPLAGIAAMAVAMAGALWLVRWSYLDVVADLFAWMTALARGEGQADAYRARVRAMAAEIAGGGEADEVLVVGHSLGGIGAIQAVAAVLDGGTPAAGAASGGGRLGLLTLGSTHGVVLAQRGAGRARLAAAVARVAADGVFWVDVTSPRDMFCVPLTDPLLLIGDAAAPGMTSPRVISAPLRDAPAIPGDRRTVFGAMRRHMGYLLAPEPGSGFDYADAVTGPLSLAERFGARGNSPKARMWQP